MQQRYYKTLELTAGCGDRAQGYIDTEWNKLAAFAKEHPEFGEQLPRKHSCEDDGTSGMASGMALHASNMARSMRQ